MGTPSKTANSQQKLVFHSKRTLSITITFQFSVNTILQKLFNNDTCSDQTVVFYDLNLFLHRNIITQSSGLFLKLFDSSSANREDHTMEFSSSLSISTSSFESVMKTLYCSPISLSHSNTFDVYVCARYFEIQELIDFCLTTINQYIEDPQWMISLTIQALENENYAFLRAVLKIPQEDDIDPVTALRTLLDKVKDVHLSEPLLILPSSALLLTEACNDNAEGSLWLLRSFVKSFKEQNWKVSDFEEILFKFNSELLPVRIWIDDVFSVLKTDKSLESILGVFFIQRLFSRVDFGPEVGPEVPRNTCLSSSGSVVHNCLMVMGTSSQGSADWFVNHYKSMVSDGRVEVIEYNATSSVDPSQFNILIYASGGNDPTHHDSWISDWVSAGKPVITMMFAGSSSYISPVLFENIGLVNGSHTGDYVTFNTTDSHEIFNYLKSDSFSSSYTPCKTGTTPKSGATVLSSFPNSTTPSVVYRKYSNSHQIFTGFTPFNQYTKTETASSSLAKLVYGCSEYLLKMSS
ncbi:hypothetical protein GEMRC1_003554 [Eukaryota sp. GEM-RC1]